MIIIFFYFVSDDRLTSVLCILYALETRQEYSFLIYYTCKTFRARSDRSCNLHIYSWLCIANSWEISWEYATQDKHILYRNSRANDFEVIQLYLLSIYIWNLIAQPVKSSAVTHWELFFHRQLFKDAMYETSFFFNSIYVHNIFFFL